MKCGFGRADITPRIGVELCGFGPFLNRHSIGVRDRLWARALALEIAGDRLLLVSCDLIGINLKTTSLVRALVKEKTGWPEDSIMIQCTHTHSGPTTIDLIGWGQPDPVYREILPYRVAEACFQAVGNLTPASLAYREVECPGIGQNREYDRDALPLEEVLKPDWRPARPDLTDTTCRIFVFQKGTTRLGFLSYFGCHPVVCCSQTRWIHGDFCGIATNEVERDFPGSTGLFLQGACGDVNTCVVHKPEQESLLALDEVSGRYARALRRGLAEVSPVKVDTLKVVRKKVKFLRQHWTVQEIEKRCRQQEKILHGPGASDQDNNVRMAMVYLLALRQMLAARKAGLSLEPESEIQGFRLGDFLFLAAPFEIFQAIKNDVRDYFQPQNTLVMSVTNDFLGYAPDKTAEKRGGYAAQAVPLILGSFPFRKIHQQLVKQLISLGEDLR